MVMIPDDKVLIYNPFEIYIEVANRGNSPAKVDSGNLTFFISHKDNPEFMQKPIPDNGIQDVLRGEILNPGCECSYKTTCSPISAQSDLKTALEWQHGLVTVYLLGYFLYQDGGGNRYKTAFCRRLDRTKRQFTIVDHPDYEYAD